MNASLWDISLLEFCQRTASSDPTPGGGSVTIVSGALGLSLVIMALEITLKKTNDQELKKSVQKLLDESRGLLSNLRNHADEDIVVFNSYMAAIRLTKQTNVEKAARKKAIGEAVELATQVPLKASQDTLDAIKISAKAAAVVADNVVSDVGAGAVMLGAALNGVLLNVDINLPHIADIPFAKKLAQQRKELEIAATEEVVRIQQFVRERLSAQYRG